MKKITKEVGEEADDGPIIEIFTFFVTRFYLFFNFCTLNKLILLSSEVPTSFFWVVTVCTRFVLFIKNPWMQKCKIFHNVQLKPFSVLLSFSNTFILNLPPTFEKMSTFFSNKLPQS